jgi:hypothetical protein
MMAGGVFKMSKRFENSSCVGAHAIASTLTSCEAWQVLTWSLFACRSSRLSTERKMNASRCTKLIWTICIQYLLCFLKLKAQKFSGAFMKLARQVPVMIPRPLVWLQLVATVATTMKLGTCQCHGETADLTACKCFGKHIHAIWMRQGSFEPLGVFKAHT